MTGAASTTGRGLRPRTPARVRSAAVSRLRPHRALAIVLGLGLVARLGVMGLYSTAVYHYFGGDSSRYLRLDFTGYHGLFSDPGMTSGYPAFLDVLQAITSQLVFTIGVQHLLGLATAVVLYATALAIGAPRAVALVPAAVVALSGDQIFIEHALLTETLWTLLIAGALYGVARYLHRPASLWSPAAAGMLLGLAATVRNVALLLPLLFAAWLLLAGGGAPRRRALAAGALLVPALVVVGGYVGAARLNDGYTGFTELSGFNLYGRVAQFADCGRFTPPPGTQQLCETRPPNQRPGPFTYQFSPDSPSARAGLRNTPASAKVLGRFGRAVALHQPLDYAKVVVKDLVRYAVPDVGADRPGSGSTPEQMSFGWTRATQQAEAPEVIAAHYAEVYTGVSPPERSSGRLAVLETYQEVFRLHGLELVLALAIATVGAVAGRGARRLTVLMLAVSAYLFLMPALLNSYEPRYVVTPSAVLATAAAVGGWAAFRARRARRAAPLER
jgi:hypothetical protein